MTYDMAGIPGSTGEKTYSTANRIDVICAQVSAETDRFPSAKWTEAQHRMFAFKREFHAARLARDQRIADAVADAKRRHDASAEIEQEDAALDRVRKRTAAIINHPPRSLADLSVKLAFYPEWGISADGEECIEHFGKDVATLMHAIGGGLDLPPSVDAGGVS